MIVERIDDDALLLVRQPDHAAMCGQMAQAWKPPAAMGPGVWSAFVSAVARHDDGWIEAEKLPVLDIDGTPLDFKSIPTALHASIWRRSVELAREQGDPFASLMIALHARMLYALHGETKRSDQQAAQQLMADLAQVIDAAIQRLSSGSDEQRRAVEPVNLEAARRLLSFMDGLSLALLGAIDGFDATEPLAFGGVVESLNIQDVDGQVRVTPWPFTSETLCLSSVGHRVDKTRFRYPSDVADRLQRGRPTELSWALVPG